MSRRDAAMECAQDAVYESYEAARANAANGLTRGFEKRDDERRVRIFKERTSTRFPASMHGYLTPVSYDAQRAVFYAQNPCFWAYDLTVDQLILLSYATELERRK